MHFASCNADVNLDSWCTGIGEIKTYSANSISTPPHDINKSASLYSVTVPEQDKKASQALLQDEVQL